jgi:dephospho-CoA kinase
MLIALTGGIGSGKSTVANFWRDLGATIIDADLLAREVVAPGSDNLELLVSLVGPELLNSDGSMNRALLADRIFKDSKLRSGVEAIMHPAIKQLARERIAAATSPVVYVVPLLVETEHTLDFDAVVSLAVPEEVRINRLVSQRAMSRSEALARIRAQATDEERARRADLVIDANCSLAELRTKAQAAFKAITGGSTV